MFQCIIIKDGKYLLSINNFGKFSTFFVEFFVSKIFTLSSTNQISLPLINNIYSLFRYNQTLLDHFSVSILNPNILMFGSVINQVQNSIPTVFNKSVSSSSGLLIFQPSLPFYVSVLSTTNLFVTINSQNFTLIPVLQGKEQLINLNDPLYLMGHFSLSISSVPFPMYLQLKMIQIPDQNIYWFINRGIDRDSISVPTEDYHLFSSPKEFALLIEYPQTILLTLRVSQVGIYSFYITENTISDLLNHHSPSPFPYFWILFGIIILELGVQILLFLIFFLRSKCGSQIIINRNEQVAPEPVQNVGPKSPEEIQIEGISALTISQSQNKTISKEEILCIVCMDKKRCVAFLPCNHKVSCVNCSKKLFFEAKKCPICRTAIQKLKYEKTPDT